VVAESAHDSGDCPGVRTEQPAEIDSAIQLSQQEARRRGGEVGIRRKRGRLRVRYAAGAELPLTR
jgi:hypothetical protein